MNDNLTQVILGCVLDSNKLSSSEHSISENGVSISGVRTRNEGQLLKNGKLAARLLLFILLIRIIHRLCADPEPLMAS